MRLHSVLRWLRRMATRWWDNMSGQMQGDWEGVAEEG
jgi:hypothetical protein